MARSIKKRNSYGMGRLLLVAHNMKLKTDYRKYKNLFEKNAKVKGMVK